jgi:hypothetical protein
VRGNLSPDNAKRTSGVTVHWRGRVTRQPDQQPDERNDIVKKLLSLTAALCMVCGMGLAHAADADKSAEKPLTPQQVKMKTCNQEAAGKKGDERKAFMKQCLRAPGTASAAATPTASAPDKAAHHAAKQEKHAAKKEKHAAANKEKHAADKQARAAKKAQRKECNQQATGKKGAERKSFMKTCMEKAA